MKHASFASSLRQTKPTRSQHPAAVTEVGSKGSKVKKRMGQEKVSLVPSFLEESDNTMSNTVNVCYCPGIQNSTIDMIENLGVLF